LAVVALIGADNYPIAFYLNYAMHPIDFYLSGVISADFPGDTARYIESRYDNKAVAVFAQSACGDQNPLFTGPMQRLLGTRTRTPGFDDERFTAASPWKLSSQMVNANEVQTTQTKNPVTRGEQPAYQRAIFLDSAMVTAMGAILGESAIDMGIERNLL
jgi:neutral ceramidase